MENIDCVYYINLDHRVDRRELFEQDFEKMGISKEKIVRIPGIYKQGFGPYGCGLSHIKALETFLASSHSNCVIFEDDFTFNIDKNYMNYIVKSVFTKLKVFDVVMFSGNVMKSEPTEYHYLKRVFDAQTASGFLVTRDFAPKILENFKEAVKMLKSHWELTGERKHEYCIDISWKTLQPNSRWYIVNPRFGYQRESYSDNEEHITNYKV